jgi:hypothetical protein
MAGMVSLLYSNGPIMKFLIEINKIIERICFFDFLFAPSPLHHIPFPFTYPHIHLPSFLIWMSTTMQ